MKTIEDFKRDFNEIRKFANDGGFTQEKAEKASQQLMQLVEQDYRHLHREIAGFLESMMRRGQLMAMIDDLVGGNMPTCDNPDCKACRARDEAEKKPEVKKRDGEDNVFEFPGNGTIN